MRAIFLFILLFLIGFTAFAQDIKLRGATSQSWSGGVCCASGTNYVITLESTDTTSQLKLDSVWIGNSCYVTTGGKVNMIRSVVGGKAVYNIQVSEYWNERDQLEDFQFNQSVISPYSGEATVVCHFRKNAPQHITVEKFKELPPIAYP